MGNFESKIKRIIEEGAVSIIEEENQIKLIPVVRKMYPQLLAEEIAGIQPMSGEHCSLFKMKVDSRPAVERYRQGELIHDFARGWLRFYGTQFIPARLWMDIMIKTGRR